MEQQNHKPRPARRTLPTSSHLSLRFLSASASVTIAPSSKQSGAAFRRGRTRLKVTGQIRLLRNRGEPKTLRVRRPNV